MGWLFNVRVNWGPGSQDRFLSCLEPGGSGCLGSTGQGCDDPSELRAPGESGAPLAEGTTPVPGGAGAPSSPHPAKARRHVPIFHSFIV